MDYEQTKKHISNLIYQKVIIEKVVTQAELSRRLYGKYMAPESKHLLERVKEIEDGKYKELIETLMNKPIEELKELYNNREIEK